MTSHELANLLLTLPDLPIATHTNNHTYTSYSDHNSHGLLKVGLLKHYSGDHIVIGNFSRMDINYPNYYVSEIYKNKTNAQ